MWFGIEQVLGSGWIYLIVAGLILIDVYVPVTPSGTTLIAASVYAYSPSASTSQWVLLVVAALASTCGDAIAFRVAGKGRGVISRLVSKHRFSHAVDTALRETLRRRLGRTVVLARFVPAGRMIVTFTSGSDVVITAAGFQRWSAVAAFCWATYTVGVGSLSAMLFDVSWLGAVVAIAAVTAVGVLFARTRFATSLNG